MSRCCSHRYQHRRRQAQSWHSDPHDEIGEVVERKVSTPGFAYHVVPRATDSNLEIVAVHHERRRPDYWAEGK